MADRSNRNDDDLLVQHIRTRAREAVWEFLQEVQDKVERDVDNRLKQLGRNDPEPEVAVKSSKTSCGSKGEWDGLENGTDDLFLRHFREGRTALNSSDLSTAIWHFNFCAQLPVASSKKAMALQQLEKALAIRRRMQPPSA